MHRCAILLLVAQRVQTGIGASTVFDLVDAADPNRGLCSVVFVGVVPTAAQKLQLQDYSRNFKVTDRAYSFLPLSKASEIRRSAQKVAHSAHTRRLILHHTVWPLSYLFGGTRRASNEGFRCPRGSTLCVGLRGALTLSMALILLGPLLAEAVVEI